MITDRHLIEQLPGSLMGENTGEVRTTSLLLRMVQRISASLVGKRLKNYSKCHMTHILMVIVVTYLSDKHSLGV